MSSLNTIAPLVLMALLGIPHGALDGYLMKSLSKNTIEFALLLGVYSLCCLLAIYSWLKLPTVSLLFFLAASVLHFGRSDVLQGACNQCFLAIVARGGLWVIALPFLHWSTAEPIFAYLQTNTAVVRASVEWAFAPWAAISGLHIAFELRNRRLRGCVEWSIGLLLIVVLPALWALCAYFCAWHARRHTHWVWSESSSVKQAWKHMLLFSGLAFGFAAAGYLTFLRDTAMESAATIIFFVGLFAVTIPHMILIDFYLPHRFEHWRISK